MKIKIVLRDDIRRFVSHKAGLGNCYQELLNFLGESFPGKEFLIRYEDEEFDRVTVTSETDLQEAVRLAEDEQRKSLKLFLSEQQKQSSVPQKRVSDGFPKAEISHQPTSRVHEGIACDMCNTKPIVGVRYKCSECEDFDLCASCEYNFVNGSHPSHSNDHPVLKIKGPKPPGQFLWGRCGRFFNSKRRMHHRSPSYPGPYFSQDPHPPLNQSYQRPPGVPDPSPTNARHDSSAFGMPNFGGSMSFPNYHPPIHPHGFDVPPVSHGLYAPAGPENERSPPLVRSYSAPLDGAIGDDSWRDNDKKKKMEKHHRRENDPQKIQKKFNKAKWRQDKMKEKMDRKMERKAAKLQHKVEKMKHRPKADFDCHVTMQPRSVCPPDTKMVKIWRFRNIGPHTWPEGCKLVFLHGDELTDKPGGFHVPRCGPNETVDVSIEIKTPQKFGRFVSYYRLSAPGSRWSEGKKFGPKVWVDFFVSPTANKEDVSMSEGGSPHPVPADASAVDEEGCRPAPGNDDPADALERMGFKDRELNTKLLAENGQDLGRVIDVLLRAKFGAKLDKIL